MLLTAWGDGVGSNWVGFGGLEQVKSLLEIPAGLDVLAILPFGYPARAVGQGKKRASRCATSRISSGTGVRSRERIGAASVDAEVVDAAAHRTAAARRDEPVLAGRERAPAA